MAKLAGMKLRCKDGHWEFASWQVVLHEIEGATRTLRGYRVVTRCDFGDHYLAETQDGAVVVRTISYDWPSQEVAEWAIRRWEQQEAGKD